MGLHGLPFFFPIRSTAWQNAVAQRRVGICRRDLLDHGVVLNERYLKRLLAGPRYHEDRAHLGSRWKRRSVGHTLQSLAESSLSDDPLDCFIVTSRLLSPIRFLRPSQCICHSHAYVSIALN